MKLTRLSELDDNSAIAAELVIIGGGAVGLTIARECASAGMDVLVLESGLLDENPEHDQLNTVDLAEPCVSSVDQMKRESFHGKQAELWSAERQPYGVRCRVLGGSTQAWAGKSSIFDEIDFRARAWVDHSGWPFDKAELAPYLKRALAALKLCPADPPTCFAAGDLASYYWQFARSRLDRLDVMRMGKEFVADKPAGVHVLIDATVTRIGLDHSGRHVSSLDLSGISGKRAKVTARTFILAASAIENARLLLASNDVHGTGVGNRHDNVGRYLVDHVGAGIGSIPEPHVSSMAQLFGFYGVRHGGRSHMFMHGLALSPEVQEREHLLNAAIYFAPQRAADDPWDAMKRLLQRKSGNVLRDLTSIARGSGFIAKGFGMTLLSSPVVPSVLKDSIVNGAIRWSPNMVAGEFERGGLPHKLTGLTLEAISEQAPSRDNRITLSHRTDRFGVPIAKVHWRVSPQERRTLRRIAELAEAALAASDLPRPQLETWAAKGSEEAIPAIDMAHSMGTTRMSSEPASGVVDADCRVHGVSNLYLAGGSVFPTGGHANPTLMMLACSIRLSDHLAGQRERQTLGARSALTISG
ncbi:MAG TPA: GMC family oxidoreductase [Sphingomicrobium sp.]|nr:GMC family oxidoreductase [Sphingomicrobium sp.]HKT86332.1 GMC family oxidoreductase [Novosphingobium sp.]